MILSVFMFMLLSAFNCISFRHGEEITASDYDSAFIQHYVWLISVQFNNAVQTLCVTEACHPTIYDPTYLQLRCQWQTWSQSFVWMILSHVPVYDMMQVCGEDQILQNRHPSILNLVSF